MKMRPSTALSLCTVALLLPALGHAKEASGHKLELKGRIVHFDRAFENPANDRTQTGLGLQLKYESPYLADTVGFGIAGYSVTRLDSSGRVVTDILKVDSQGKYHDSFGKIAEAYLKIRHRDVVEVTLGRQVHNSLLLFSATSRAVPNTYSGASAAVMPTQDLKLYGALYDRWSRRAGSGFEKFATDRSARGDIDYVGVLGANYRNGPVAVTFEYLESKDFLRKAGLVGSYTFALPDMSTLKLTGGVHTSQDAGKLFVTASASSKLDDEDKYPAGARSDNDGLGAYIDLEWRTGNLMLGAGVAKFDGAWVESNFAGDHGMNPFPTGGALADMTNRDETVWVVRAGYDWKDYVKGLRTGVSYKKGTGARNSHVPHLGKADEDELDIDLRYQVPAVKGLNLRYRYLKYTSNKVGLLDGVLPDNTDHRVYIDYTYRFF